MKHIGIAGITVPGSLLCIDTIIAESYRHFGSDSGKHPRITYTNPSLSDIDPSIINKQWDIVAEDLLASATILSKAGADFVIIPSNSPHYAIEAVKAKATIPVVSIVDLTIEECRKRQFHKVGILGVEVTMSDGLYEKPLKDAGIEPYTLPVTEQKALDKLIYSEIILGKPTASTTQKMLHFIQQLKDAGCDAFIAGCTEIPVVIDEASSPLPFVDTTRLLAIKAFELALAE